MINWFKSLFKKKIYLPLWLFLIGGNPTTENTEEYYNLLDKIGNSLIEGKSVIILVNNKPHLIEKINKKIQMTEIEDYKIEL